MWLEELFNTNKPVIGMVHLRPMPTDPKYSASDGIESIITSARRDLIALQNGGIDGVLFCNEFSIPYTRNVNGVVSATYARVIGELRKEISVPFGITCASSTKKTYDIAVAVEADFVRTHTHGATAGVYGINSYDPGELERYRFQIGGGNLKVLTAVIPEGAKQIAERTIEEVASTLSFNVNPDGLLIYSTVPGEVIDINQVISVKSVTSTPVLASNGVRPDTVEEILKYTDGCIVGTGIKLNGNFYNQVDETRVRKLMENAKRFRKEKSHGKD